MEPWRAITLSDEGMEAWSRATLLVGRTSVLTASDLIRRGTSSVPMLPEADVMKTLDMMMFPLGKDHVCFLEKENESVYATDYCF